MKKLAYRLWNSPTITTWASLVVLSANTIFVLPLVLTKFSLAEANIWFVFMTIFRFKDIFDFGLKNNVSRLYSYACGGVKDISSIGNIESQETSNEPNFLLIASIYNKSVKYYSIVFILAILVLGIIGTISLYGLIGAREDNWIAWLILLLGSCIFLFGNLFTSYLIGINKVALLKRWDTFFGLLTSFSIILVMLTVPSLLNIIIIMNFWVIINVLRNYYLVKKTKNSFLIDYDKFNKKHYLDVSKSIIEPSWRTFVAGLAGTGTKYGLNLIIANLVSAEISASYLLADRLLDQLKEVSRAPFYSNIPRFSKLRAQNKIFLLVKEVKQAMLFSYGVNFIGIVGLLFFGNYLISLIGSNVTFVSNMMLVCMGFYLFIERFTAMHLQLYTFMKNRVIGHIGLIVTGILLLLLTSVLFPILSIMAIPIAGILSYLFFYSWFVALKNYKILETSFVKFEKKLIILFNLLLILLFIIYEILIPHTQ
ncbi:hypothetical protein [Cellulophaga fucicola]|uniref:Membrane protein involved in the export of O-antigen and teichoic acid n=1 Tax=Cellulophaga fucicola TaxID=76595 RepID=A0A1K1QA34_9FLAO|nr:hypothetical protein [Cellulophaga fucicola]SFW56581.1 Membrane protein involved in the export of O-antigen and teichoic acid [Cellulophaga fucicola]